MNRTLALTFVAATFAAAPLVANGTLPTGSPLLHSHSLDTYWESSHSGGPGKDGIPSIDDPRFWSAAEGDRFLDDGDIVMGVYRNGEARAYPQRILVWHEIVNDTVGGDNLAVTYCPLTGTGMGFKRGETELGVSGRLVNSNMIMYDRESDSYWPQIPALAVHGPRKGQGLEEFRVFWTTWENWQDRHPETEVLSRRTGHARNYRRDPYGGYNPLDGYYEERSRPIMPTLEQSGHYPPKHKIFGFRTEDEAVAVNKPWLSDAGYAIHQGENGSYLILHDPGLETAWVYRGAEDDMPRSLNPDAIEFAPAGPKHEALEGLEEVNGFEAMWFAWHAFYPDTVILDGRND